MPYTSQHHDTNMPVRPLEPIVPPTDLSPVRVRVSYRWFSGTLLNGIAGLVLMGGALYVAIDGQSKFAVAPATDLTNSRPQDTESPTAKKQDKFARPLTTQAIRSVIHESNTRLVGSKEFIDVKRYARVSAHLALTRSDATGDLPDFDPLALFAEAAEKEQNRTSNTALTSYGTIDVQLRALKPTSQLYRRATISDSEAGSMIREALELSGKIDQYLPQTASLPGEPSGSGDELLSNIDGWRNGLSGTNLLRVNLTEIKKTGGKNTFANVADAAITIQPGDTLSTILKQNGATREQAQAIANAMEPVFPASHLKEGQDLRINLEPGGGSGSVQPVRVSLFDESNHKVTVGMGDDGGYRILDAGQALVLSTSTEPRIAPRPAPQQSRAALYYSLYETGIRQDVPQPVLDRIIRVHSYDVDFKRDTQAGDSLEVFYQLADEYSDTGEAELLYTALTVHGETRRFYRFRTPDDGVVDYYDDEGRSAKKFLIRKPLNGGVLRSQFGMRRHPILGYRKLHTGVDWAASRGTPIVAAGNGIVERAKWSRGYGRYTVIRHANGYKTAYAHQTAFADGLEPGMRVRQGQVIGYVGSSGLSTGPHLHYEVIVNGNYVNPMRIRVPRGRTLQGRMLAAFQRERARINKLMSRPPASTQVADAAGSLLRR